MAATAQHPTAQWRLVPLDGRRKRLVNQTGAAVSAVKLSTTHTQNVVAGCAHLDDGDGIEFEATTDAKLAVVWTDIESGELRVRLL